MRELYVKSPMNYIGGKFKMLPKFENIFPNDISMFYDIFGGGGTISLNVDSEFVFYNDIVFPVVDILKNMSDHNYNDIIKKIESIIETYDLSKTNRVGFEKLREDYNNSKERDWCMLYTLMCYSFNSQYRFNNKKEYNSSFGKNKSCFSDTTKKKIKSFSERIDELDITFSSDDFRDVDLSDADSNDLVYFDPPYLITCGNYNDGKRGFKGWSDSDDIDLMDLCDNLDKQGTRFAMSNVLQHKGATNERLKEWSNKYNVNFLDYNYNNCNYQQSNNIHKTLEVVITNY